MHGEESGRIRVTPVELEMGVWGLRVDLKRNGIDYAMNLHETRNGHFAAEMARMLQDRLDLAVEFAVEDALAAREKA